MKFLEYTPLERINVFLNHLNLGESTIHGTLEAFSCKQAGNDKKLSISLEHEILDYLGRSSESDSCSPVDLLYCRSSRKTMIYLILTLSHMFPDYDFSAVESHLFFKEEEWDSFKQIFENYMFQAAQKWAAENEGSSLYDIIRSAIDEVIKLGESEIYSYNPDFDNDPCMEKGAIWSFLFFFYNRKQKRVLSFRCCCSSNSATEEDLLPLEATSGQEDDMLTDMDM